MKSNLMPKGRKGLLEHMISDKESEELNMNLDKHAKRSADNYDKKKMKLNITNEELFIIQDQQDAGEEDEESKSDEYNENSSQK